MNKRLKFNLSAPSAPVALFALYNGTSTDCLVSEKESYPEYSRAAPVQAIHCIYLDYGEWCPLGLYDAACL